MKLVGSVVFANVAGSTALGVFYVFMSLYRIGRRLTALGMGQAIVTQISEADAQGEPAAVGRVVASSLAVRAVPLVALGALGSWFATRIDAYVGMSEAWAYLLVAVGATIVFGTARATLSGRRRVDLSSSLDIVRDVTITGVQVTLVVLGFKAFGLVAGFVIGLVGTTVLSVALVLPSLGGFGLSVERARSLVSFAKFAYLDTLVGGEQIWLDVLLLGLFVGGAVSQGDIGIYGIAYSTAMFGFALSAAIGRSILPEITGFEASDDGTARDRTVNESLRYGALLALPLAFGALGVGDLVLRDVYGFGRGYTALVVLGFGAIAFSVYQPIHQTLYGLDHPSWAFAVSLVTSLLNGGLNLVLIPRAGIVGTAISTALSMILALVVGLGLLKKAGIGVDLPLRTWGLQIAASILMVSVVYALRLQSGSGSRPVTVALVLVGGVVYAGVLVVGDDRLRRRLGGQLERFS